LALASTRGGSFFKGFNALYTTAKAALTFNMFAACSVNSSLFTFLKSLSISILILGPLSEKRVHHPLRHGLKWKENFLFEMCYYGCDILESTKNVTEGFDDKIGNLRNDKNIFCDFAPKKIQLLALFIFPAFAFSTKYVSR